jgi:hypothetical protein
VSRSRSRYLLTLGLEACLPFGITSLVLQFEQRVFLPPSTFFSLATSYKAHPPPPLAALPLPGPLDQGLKAPHPRIFMFPWHRDELTLLYGEEEGEGKWKEEKGRLVLSSMSTYVWSTHE